METRRNLYARDAELAVAIAGLANHHGSCTSGRPCAKPRKSSKACAPRKALRCRRGVGNSISTLVMLQNYGSGSKYRPLLLQCGDVNDRPGNSRDPAPGKEQGTHSRP
jgi:hypothetical protein